LSRRLGQTIASAAPKSSSAARVSVADELQPDQQDERPEDVELLLDRERPEVVQRLFRREAREVGHVGGDLLPVVDVEDRRDDRLAELIRLGGAEDRHPGDHDQQHQEQRRQQAAGAGEPEAAEVDRPAAHELAEQDVGDQVAGEGEEDADPEQAAGRPAEAEVEADDRQDRDRAQAVQPWHIALSARDRFGHRKGCIVRADEADSLAARCRSFPDSNRGVAASPRSP
jgi:hypothetical protein